MDTQYCGTDEGVDGPVLTKLRSYGHIRSLVFGVFGESSPDAHLDADDFVNPYLVGNSPSTDKTGVIMEAAAVSDSNLKFVAPDPFVEDDSASHLSSR